MESLRFVVKKTKKIVEVSVLLQVVIKLSKDEQVEKDSNPLATSNVE